MPIGRISFNIHAQGVRDKPTLFATLREIDPTSVLVMDGLNMLLEIKTMLPRTIAIDREYPDVLGLPNTETPESWLARKSARVLDNDIWNYTTNEPLLSNEIVDWHIRLIKENAKRLKPLKLVILNLGVGQPNDWGHAEELLRLASTYRQWCIIGLHEYAAVVPTSGFIGGSPDMHNIISAANWPRGAAIEKIKPPLGKMWHCGRVFEMNAFCKSKGIALPRVILTEHGFDSVRDVEFWYNTLQTTAPYSFIAGWKTLVQQWRIFFPQWSEGRTLFEALKYLNEEIYKNSNVEGQLIYCWGWIDRQWENFDVSENTVFHAFLKEYVRDTSMATPINPPVPKPNPAGLAYKGKVKSASRVRTGNGTTYDVLYTASYDDEFTYYPDSTKFDSLRRYVWVWVEPVKAGQSAGWMALIAPLDELFQRTDIIEPPPPPPTTTLPFAPFPDFSRMTPEQRSAVAETLSWIWQVTVYVGELARMDNQNGN